MRDHDTPSVIPVNSCVVSPYLFLSSFSLVSIFRFPFFFLLPEHPLFEDATVFRCVLSGSQLWRAPSPHPTRLPALSNHHPPGGAQRRGPRPALPPQPRRGELGRQRQFLGGGRRRGELVPLQSDAGWLPHQVRELQVNMWPFWNSCWSFCLLVSTCKRCDVIRNRCNGYFVLKVCFVYLTILC